MLNPTMTGSQNRAEFRLPGAVGAQLIDLLVVVVTICFQLLQLFDFTFNDFQMSGR